MPTVSAADLDAILNLAGQVSNEHLENIIDLSIDLLNLLGADLSNMSGTAGDKSVGLESPEKAAVFLVARTVYYGFYKDLDTSSVGGLTVSTPDLMSNPAVLQAVNEAARHLIELDVSRG